MSESLIKQDAEAGLLGSLIACPDQVLSYSDKLKPEMFGLEANRAVWAKLKEMAENKVSINLVTLKESLTEHLLSEIGGINYLGSLMANVPDNPPLESYFKIVEEFWVRRSYREISERLSKATTEAKSLEEIQLIADEARCVTNRSSVPDIEEASSLAADRVARERKQGVDLLYGIPQLDSLLGGIRRGKLTVLGGKTSHGKTTVCTNIILNVLKTNPKAKIIYSGFENIEDIPIKLASINSGIPLTQFTQPSSISDEQLDRVMLELLRLGEYKNRLLLLSGEGPAKIRQIAREYRPDIVFLDYVQRCAEKQGATDDSGRRLIVGSLTAQMQDIALEFNCHSFVLSQIRRLENERRHQEPELSDLKECGELENYSDNAILLWWPWRETMNDSKFSQTDYRFGVKKNKLGPCMPIAARLNLQTLGITG